MSDSQYKVLPNTPHCHDVTPVTLTVNECNNIKGLNGGVSFFLWIAIVVLVAFISVVALGIELSILLFILSLAITTAFVFLANYWTVQQQLAEFKEKKIKQEKSRVEWENEKEVRRVNSEAESLTSSILSTYRSSINLAPELSHHLSQAATLLRNAEGEYQDNAFSPFWDAIENAAKQLAAFNDRAKQLSQYADDYYRNLAGRTHTFPVFPVQLATIPNPSHEVGELRCTVRLGQTNFQFANIWEHRRTREVLIAGFRTLGEAVNNLGATIESSISNLEQTVSSDFAKVVEEQIRTRETLDKRMIEQNRMLDNIQHHREPSVTDTPARY
jgi:hypothetical protein